MTEQNPFVVPIVGDPNIDDLTRVKLSHAQLTDLLQGRCVLVISADTRIAIELDLDAKRAVRRRD